MITSAYKNRRIPHKGHLCAICQLQTRRSAPAQLVVLAYGVSVWLCPTHASEEFQTMRGGRDFVATLMRVWLAAGVYTRRHDKALTAHLNRINGNTRPPKDESELPGSYNWKALRNETEHRAAAGESLQSIIRDLRERHADDVADAPSERTIRRWYNDRRWERGIRTPLRPGYERRDPRRATRAQRDRVAITRMREARPASARASSAEGSRPGVPRAVADARLRDGEQRARAPA